MFKLKKNAANRRFGHLGQQKRGKKKEFNIKPIRPIETEMGSEFRRPIYHKVVKADS